MNQINGINQSALLIKLQHIKDAWTRYFWVSRFCQQSIRFTEEQKTNYIADLYHYFEDTIHLLSKFKLNDNYRAALYDTVAVLQFMYIQQDLLDELLFVFKIPKSNSDDKKLIRSLRNELIGHPISRMKDKKYKSSVFITANTSGTNLSYVRYYIDNGNKNQNINHNWEVLFQHHENYLNVHLAKINDKIDDILHAYMKEIQYLVSYIPEAKFLPLVNRTEFIFKEFHSEEYIFSKDNILFCYENKERHPRYKNAIDLYTHSLYTYSAGKINGLCRFINHSKCEPTMDNISIPSNVNSRTTSNNTDLASTRSYIVHRTFNDEFDKLHNRHPLYNVSYFKRHFESDIEIIEELNNMDNNYNNNAEYYSSYCYLELLLKRKGFISDDFT